MIEIRVGVVLEIHLFRGRSMDLIAVIAKAEIHITVDLVEDLLLWV